MFGLTVSDIAGTAFNVVRCSQHSIDAAVLSRFLRGDDGTFVIISTRVGTSDFRQLHPRSWAIRSGARRGTRNQ